MRLPIAYYPLCLAVEVLQTFQELARVTSTVSVTWEERSKSVASDAYSGHNNHRYVCIYTYIIRLFISFVEHENYVYM